MEIALVCKDVIWIHWTQGRGRDWTSKLPCEFLHLLLLILHVVTKLNFGSFNRYFLETIPSLSCLGTVRAPGLRGKVVGPGVRRGRHWCYKVKFANLDKNLWSLFFASHCSNHSPERNLHPNLVVARSGDRRSVGVWRMRNETLVIPTAG